MSQKSIKFNRHKAQSQNDRKIRSSQHSKFKNTMADQLREKIHKLIQKQDEADAETWKSYTRFEKFKAYGDEKQAEFHWMFYNIWKDQLHRLVQETLINLKAVQKFQLPNNIEEPKIKYKNKQYMKYGPSDEEE